jgi:hypothetical protein
LRAETQRLDSFIKVFACEKTYQAELGKYKLKCRIDRIDETQEGYEIFDYKTGSKPKQVNTKTIEEIIDENLDRASIKWAVGSLQLPLYKFLFENNEHKKIGKCAIYSIKDAQMFSFAKDCSDKVYDDCMTALKYILDEINSGDFFEFDEGDIGECGHCPFVYICR